MKGLIILTLLPSLALALPRPQDIDLDAVEAAADPIFVTPAVNVVAQTASDAPSANPTYLPAATSSSTDDDQSLSSAAASASASSSAQNTATQQEDDHSKRHLFEARDGNCAELPKGSGPVINPDTVDSFTGSTDISVECSSSISYSMYS